VLWHKKTIGQSSFLLRFRLLFYSDLSFTFSRIVSAFFFLRFPFFALYPYFSEVGIIRASYAQDVPSRATLKFTARKFQIACWEQTSQTLVKSKAKRLIF